MVCYSHLFQNFPEFIVIHTVKGFGIVNKAEIGVYLELSCFFRYCQMHCEQYGDSLVPKSCPTLVTTWTVACRAPLSMGFSRQEYWSGLPFPSPGDLPDPGIEPKSPALQTDSLPTEL